MMSLVRAQLEEPKKKIYLMVYLLFLFLYLDFEHRYYGNTRALYRLSVAQEVACLPNAAGGGCREDGMVQRSILCECFLRANKIGHRKVKHDESDVAGSSPAGGAKKKRTEFSVRFFIYLFLDCLFCIANNR